MSFSAKGLPNGLALDSRTGKITGVAKKKGEYEVTLRAKNAHGAAERKFRIVIGDKLALTPPMGWSTWYMAKTAISDRMVRDQADAMVSSGMVQHGYAYINIDDGWNIRPNSPDPVLGGTARDTNGNLKTNPNFPDMKALCDYVHSKGLKIGIYISPGPLTCARFEGSYGHEEQDARQFAAWGFDFLKYDYCSYRTIANEDLLSDMQKPYFLMGDILKRLDRDFVYNLCLASRARKAKVWEWARETGGHFWRTADDVGIEKRSLWDNMLLFGFDQAGMEKWAGPGGWNDPDNILIGHIMQGRKLAPTPLTPDEQYTWVSLWSLMASPLVFGGDMTKLDDFTLSLLTNDEVIDVNQDPSGKQAAPVSKTGDAEVWSKQLEDGSLAVGLFNRSNAETEVTARWSDLSIRGERIVRDLWRQKDIGRFNSEFKVKVASHGVALVKFTVASTGR
jgi:alpha-galactosidase